MKDFVAMSFGHTICFLQSVDDIDTKLIMIGLALMKTQKIPNTLQSA